MNETRKPGAGFAEWLSRQRWYGDKSRRLDRVEVDQLSQLDLDGPVVELALITCEFADAPPSRYVVPIIQPESAASPSVPGEPIDAFAEPRFLVWLYAGFGPERTMPVHGSRSLRWIAGAAPLPPTSGVTAARLMQAEQSNTSVRFGDDVILKVFRKVQPGINPDPEILRYLAAHTDYGHAPADLGTIEIHDPASDEPVVVAAMQRFVPNLGDAWTWLLAELGGSITAGQDRLLGDIALLGRRTAELHLALGAGSDDPAFAVEPVVPAYLNRMRERLRTELDLTMDRLLGSSDLGVEQIDALRNQLVLKQAEVGGLDGASLCRIHGDFHLGQVLKTANDFVIIDFEGEPSRPFHERRAKASPLKDVAGMLRSFHYAVATTEGSSVEGNDVHSLHWFRAEAPRVYLHAYMETMAASGSRLVPAGALSFQSALDVFLIEKALYEVRYELDNRPAWLHIPLDALDALAVP